MPYTLHQWLFCDNVQLYGPWQINKQNKERKEMKTRHTCLALTLTQFSWVPTYAQDPVTIQWCVCHRRWQMSWFSLVNIVYVLLSPLSQATRRKWMFNTDGSSVDSLWQKHTVCAKVMTDELGQKTHVGQRSVMLKERQGIESPLGVLWSLIKDSQRAEAREEFTCLKTDLYTIQTGWTPSLLI